MREGFQRVFRGFSEVFRDFSEVVKGPLRDPLRGRFPSQRLSVLIVLPLELSPQDSSSWPGTGRVTLLVSIDCVF